MVQEPGINSMFRGEETILIVDDEERILRSIKDVLILYGYKVLTASNGAKAVKIYEKNCKKIDLVIMDIMMPMLNGKQASDRIKELNPDAKIIVSSGFIDSELATQMLAAGTTKYVEKPFHLQELLYTVRACLDTSKKR